MKIHLKLILLTVSFLAVNTSYADDMFGDFNIFANHFMTKSVKKITNHIDLLFVENADNASLLDDPVKKGCKDLSIWPINHGVQYFTNEPARVSGSIPPQQFVNFWHEQGSKTDPFIPNVDIEGIKTGHKHYDQAASLAIAQYDDKQQKMTFLACPLHQQTLPNIKHLHLVSIFFDGFFGFPPT